MRGTSQFETGYKPTAADGRSGSNPWKAGYKPVSVVGSWVFIVTTKSNYCTISFQLHYAFFFFFGLSFYGISPKASLRSALGSHWCLFEGANCGAQEDLSYLFVIRSPQFSEKDDFCVDS